MRSTLSNPDLNSQFLHHQQDCTNIPPEGHHHHQHQPQPHEPADPSLNPLGTATAASGAPSTNSAAPLPPRPPASHGPKLSAPKRHTGHRHVSAPISKSTTSPSSSKSSTFISRNPRIKATTSHFPPRRNPLQRRDQNEKLHEHSPRKRSKLAAMPPPDNKQTRASLDKQPNQAQRPLMPTLTSTTTQKKAVGSFRSSAPAALNPKIANPSSSSSSSSSSSAVANNAAFSKNASLSIGTSTPNPLVRRSQVLQRPESAYGIIQSTPKDDSTNTPGPSTPVSAFFSTNITPRSGSRQSRVDSTQSTAVAPAAAPSSPLAASGTVAGDIDGTMPRKAAVISFSPSPSGTSTPNPRETRMQRSNTSTDRDSKFFYASDANAKSKPPTARQQPRQQQQQDTPPVRPTLGQHHKTPAFFHANGDAIDRGAVTPSRPTSMAGNLSPAIGSPTMPQHSQQQQGSKFFYANGAPDMNKRKVGSAQSPTAAGATTPTGPGPSLARSAATTPSGGVGGAVRPMSPTKLSQQSAFTSHKNSSLPSVATRCAPLAPTGSGSGATAAGAATPAGSSNTGVGINRGGVPTIETPSRPSPKAGHARAGSVPTVEQIITMTKLMSSQLSSECSTPASVKSNSSQLGATPRSAGGEYFSDAEDDNGSDGLQSPTKQPKNSQLDDLVANARRERKVQDLQITNASLEAINRTLERQMRKQQAELRRYRRLSRSGRLSLTPGPSNDVFDSETLDVSTAAESSKLSDLDEQDEQEGGKREKAVQFKQFKAEEEEEEQDDEDEDEDDDEMDSSALSGSDSNESISPEEQSIRDAKHREKDERRLKIDLSKHRQILVDSQKMNQSLKRCLNWSDIMIKDGQKALAYSVRVSDIELGGRILPPADDDDMEDVTIPGMEDLDDTFTEDYTSTMDHPSPSPSSAEPEKLWAKLPHDRDSGIEMPPVDGGR